MKKFELLPPIKPHHAGCLCCAGAEVKLSLDTVLCNGFGGWWITKNGTLFFMDDPGKEWHEFKTLSFVEEQVKNDPDNDYRAICETPLHGETYQRQNGEWILVEQNEGFA